MLNIAAFMVLKNDFYYLPMALQSILPYVKGVYIQDQMSTDGSYEKAKELMKQFDLDNFENPDNPIGLCVEQIDTGTDERFGSKYDEPRFRTMAVKRAEEIFKPDWILKCDADEIFTEHFFNSLANLLSDPDFSQGVNGVKVAGERFVSMTHRSMYPEGMEFSPSGVPFPDPHVQLWKANHGHYYIPNPAFNGYFHPILLPSPKPIYWLEGICNIHLHRTFGPKSFNFWAEGGDLFERKSPFHAPTMAPKWFQSERNMGTAEKVDYKWPEYVLTKWREWGIW